jgi:amino acid transporter
MSVTVASVSSKSPASLGDSREDAWSPKLSLIKTTTLNRFDIFLFGMNIVLGKQFNDPYFGGFSSMITAMLFTGLGYVFLTFCLAEMASTLPFSGGIYGFVRAFTIPIFGFYIAWFELLTNLFYHTTQIYLLSQIPIEIGVSPKSMTLVFCGLINIYLLIVHMIEGKLYWAINLIFGCVVLLLVFIYIFGSFHEINMDRWASSSEPFHFQNVLRLLPRASMSYLGIQVLPLTNKWAKNSRTDIPFVTNIATAVMFVTGIALAVLASGNRPGNSVIGDSNYPLSYGFARIFGISVTAATWFSFPAYLANVTSLTFSAARQAINLANSGFSPPFFRWLIPVLETPYLALLGGCSCSFLLNVLIVYQEKALEQMIILTSLASQIVFVFAFLAYICFRGHYTSLVRSFVSPFGTVGAYIGLAIFSLSFIGTVAAQDGGWSPIVTIVGATIFMVVCYVIFIGGNQSFSEEEKNKLFKAYLVNGKYIYLFYSVVMLISLSF